MQRILSEVWLSVVAASVALSIPGCDDPSGEIDEVAARELDLASGPVDRPDDVAPLTPEHDPDMPVGEGDDPTLCMCPADDEPVCGVDGETYQNACAAACSGVDVDYPGKCECVCPLNWDPVCGADGQTYGNACAAGCAGADVNYQGVCTGDSCVDDADCFAANQFCNRDNNCGGEGVCEIRADNCPDKQSPTCGCDGKVYESPCMAHVFGVSIAPPETCQIEGEPPSEF